VLFGDFSVTPNGMGFAANTRIFLLILVSATRCAFATGRTATRRMTTVFFLALTVASFLVNFFACFTTRFLQDLYRVV
jgi:hypothetical protein